MCVLLYVRPGAAMPDLLTLRDCWDANPDGAGYAYTVPHGVRYVKGLMSWKAFKKAWLKEAIPPEAHTLIHFRIATHGGKPAHLTHPFPLGTPEVIHALEGIAPSVVAHNGILDCPVFDGHSDTSSFVLGILGDLKVYGGTGTRANQYLLNTACKGNRVMELTPFGPVFYGDKWELLSPGVYASNLYFLDMWMTATTFEDKDLNAAWGLDDAEPICEACGMALDPDDAESLTHCPFCNEPLQFN